MRERIEQAGAELLYLPPYSSDFNPIEQCWAKIKEHLRASKARLLDILEQAVAEAIALPKMQPPGSTTPAMGYDNYDSALASDLNSIRRGSSSLKPSE